MTGKELMELGAQYPDYELQVICDSRLTGGKTHRLMGLKIHDINHDKKVITLISNVISTTF